MRFPHGKGHRYRQTREERDSAQHTANSRTGGVYWKTDGVCQNWQCHPFRACAINRKGGKGKDADCN